MKLFKMTSSDKVKFVHSLINFAILVFHIFEVWPQKHSTIIYTVIGYLLIIFFTAGWTIAKCIGTAMLEKRREIKLLGPPSLHCLMNTLRAFVSMYNFEDIKRSYHQITEFPLNNDEYDNIQKKIKTFSRNSVAYVVFSALGSVVVDEDWKNYFIYWLSYWLWTIFSFFVLDSFIPTLISLLIYMSALKLKLLSNRISELGYENLAKGYEILKSHTEAFRSLYRCIKINKQIFKGMIEGQNMFSSTFLIQMTTNCNNIISVIYYMPSENVTYSVNDFVTSFSLRTYIHDICLLILMYYSNADMLAYEGLFKSVYESNWMDASVRYRKTVTTFMERLKKPQEMRIEKFFPLSIKTLTAILNVSYTLFNVLRNNRQGKST